MHPEYQYLNSLKEILEHGEKVPNRTGVDTIRLLGVTHRYDFKDGFPLLTTKKVWFKGVAHELLWFLSGSTNIKYLVDNGVNIWNDDAYRHYLKSEPCDEGLHKDTWLGRVKSGDWSYLGELGPVYGAQWRRWTNLKSSDFSLEGMENNPIDQISNLIKGLKNNPYDRGHIINAWNVADLDKMALRPCHVMSQYTIYGGRLWCNMIQRSCDMMLGVPFNIASYALLTHMLAQVVGIDAGGLIHHMVDAHIYEPHISAVKEQLKREPHQFPSLLLNPDIDNIDDFKYSDLKIDGYDYHPAIKAELVT